MTQNIKIFSTIIFLLASAGIVSAQEPYSVRVNQIIQELNSTNKDMAKLNNDLSAMAGRCDCKNSQSQCQQSGAANLFAIGDACPERNAMEKKQMEMRNKADQASFLEKLLKAEMDSGLDAQVKTMQPEKGKELKEYLNNILGDSEKIRIPVLENIRIVSSDDYSSSNKCSSNCSSGYPTKFSACIFNSAGEQKPITLKFNVNAGLDELKLGEIKIDTIKLNLPNELNLADLISFSGGDIILPEISKQIPSVRLDQLGDINMDSTIITPNTVSLLDSFSVGLADLVCPQSQNTTQYQCNGQPVKSQYYTDLEWYLGAFSWLSEQCQEIPTMKDDYGVPTKEKMNLCMDKDNVHLSILNQCEDLWDKYLECFAQNPLNFVTRCYEPFKICRSFKSPEKIAEEIRTQCQNVYTQKKESVPSECSSGNALKTLQNKCDSLRKSGEEMPEPCKYLPLFTKNLAQPDPKNYDKIVQSCPSQKSSSGLMRSANSCFSLNYPSKPILDLPDVIIPDIDMGSFSFMPFLKVKLPKFIFEDLVFSDMSICNLSACSNLLNTKIAVPNLNFQIPNIKIPEANVKVPGAPSIKDSGLRIGDIEFPSMYFKLPNLDLSKMIDLNMLFPEIPMPSPRISVSFSGLDLDVMNLLLGLVSSFINIPSGCIGGGANIPVVISFPDYYFYWPRFAEVAKTPNYCEMANGFCQDTQSSLNQILGKFNQIQGVINKSVQVSQDKINNATAAIEKKIREKATEALEKARSDMEDALGQSFKDALAEARRLGQNFINPKPAVISERRIPILIDDIMKELAKVPTTIPIDWPEDLKTIKLPQPIIIPLGSIPLENLSYNKEISLNIPGFQKSSMSIDLNLPGYSNEFSSSSASGGNPLPIQRINTNTSQTNDISKSIGDISEKANALLNF
jgi:hypothetical protein